MAKFSKYEHGQFNWVDLNSTDQAKAEEFYAGLFGWEASPQEIPDGGHYTMFLLDGESVAGVGQMSDEMKEQGIPSMWNSYVCVNNVADVAGKVEGLGGKVIVPPMDVMEQGRLAFFTDSTGATIGVWEPKAHKGAGIANDPGAFCWNELASSDLEKSKAFYGGLFGWTFEDSESSAPGGVYVSIKNGGASNGGMMTKPEMAAKAPDYWAAYFAVEDLTASVARLEQLGGKTMFDPMEIPNIGTMAWAMDPTNAAFVLLQMKEGVAGS